jgi:transcriptional regulator with XRE-family HTH domain
MSGQYIKEVFGKNIKFFRFRKLYSQADLAEKANISISFLSNIERGIKFPKPDVLWQISESLEIKVYELFKTDIIPETYKDQIKNLSDDLSRKVNQTLEEVLNQYFQYK